MEQEKGKIVPLQREATGEDTLIRTRVRSTKTKHHGADEFRRLIREAEKKKKQEVQEERRRIAEEQKRLEAEEKKQQAKAQRRVELLMFVILVLVVVLVFLIDAIIGNVSELLQAVPVGPDAILMQVKRILL